MKQQPPERTKRLAVIAAAAVILVMVLLVMDCIFQRGRTGSERLFDERGAAAQLFDAVVPGVRAGGIADNPGHAGPTGGGDRLWAVERLCDQLFGIGGGKLSGVSAGAPPGKSH